MYQKDPVEIGLGDRAPFFGFVGDGGFGVTKVIHWTRTCTKMQLASIQLPKREVAHSSAWGALYLTYTLKGHLWMDGWVGAWVDEWTGGWSPPFHAMF